MVDRYAKYATEHLAVAAARLPRVPKNVTFFTVAPEWYDLHGRISSVCPDSGIEWEPRKIRIQWKP